MPNFSGRVVGVGASGFNDTDPTLAGSPLMALGTIVEGADGRMWRWCKAGTSNLVAGNIIQSSAIQANHLARAVPTAGVPVGATSFEFTPGNTAGAANLYAEGYLQVDTAPGLGSIYGVAGHKAITASTAFTLNLDASDPVQVALVNGTSTVGLVAHPYQNVIQYPTTATGSLVGVANYIITASQNGWLQTWGPASVLQSDTSVVGLCVGAPSATAGAVVIYAAATTVLVGQLMQAAVSAHSSFVFLRIG